MNTASKIIIIAALGATIVMALALKKGTVGTGSRTSPAIINRVSGISATGASAAIAARLPRLLDLGADKCVPCKKMAPILESLKTEYAGRLQVEFIDVWLNPDAGKEYGIEMIPTQIFFDANGKELFRHTGFYGREDILGKWKELGVDVTGGKPSSGIVREMPVAVDTRPPQAVCFMCDGDVNPKTRTLVKGRNEQHVLCGLHCYFVYFSSIVGADPGIEEAKVSVTDWASGRTVAATTASYIYGIDSKGRATIRACGDTVAASKEQQSSGGIVVNWELLRSKELAIRCTFCDRAVYPEDACSVKLGTTHGYGCCTHCAMGVAARLKQDIEVEAKDGLTGEIIRVGTLDGQVASLNPATAIAWFGQKKGPDGKWVSAGCFKQGFFVSEANLQRWLDAHPAFTGRQITIAQALSDKMKLSPDQIARACKLGECK